MATLDPNSREILASPLLGLSLPQQATVLKDYGSLSYRARDFVTALKKYDEAAELDPQNMVYSLNKAAVHMEMEDYPACIVACDWALALGTEQLDGGYQSASVPTSGPSAAGHPSLAATASSFDDGVADRDKVCVMMHKAYLRKGKASLLSGKVVNAEAAFTKAATYDSSCPSKAKATDRKPPQKLSPDSKLDDFPSRILEVLKLPNSAQNDANDSARQQHHQQLQRQDRPMETPYFGGDAHPMASVTGTTGAGGDAALAGDTPALAAASAPSPNTAQPSAGNEVVLSGLSTAKYNGAKGTVIAVTADGTRLIVKLDSTSKEIRVKPYHCTVTDPQRDGGVQGLAKETYTDKPPDPAGPLSGSVTLDASPPAESSAAQAHVVGATVTLVGLKTEKFNGLTGILRTGVQPDNDRIAVRITAAGASLGKELLIKPANLLLSNAADNNARAMTPAADDVVTSTYHPSTEKEAVEEPFEELSFESLLQQFKEEDQEKKTISKKARRKASKAAAAGVSNQGSPPPAPIAGGGGGSSKKKKRKKKKNGGNGAGGTHDPSMHDSSMGASVPTNGAYLNASKNAAAPLVKCFPVVHHKQDHKDRGDVIKVEVRHDGPFPKTTLSTGRPITEGKRDPIYSGKPLKEDSSGAKAKLIKGRRDEMEQKEKLDKLSLQDVADYEIFVQGLVTSMESDKLQIARKYRMAEAKLKLARDPKRVRMLSDEIDSLKRREKRFNEDVAIINQEVDQFHSSPAFKMARSHVLENFVEQGGTWVNKKTLEEDVVDFEALLKEMKTKPSVEESTGQVNPLSLAPGRQ